MKKKKKILLLSDDLRMASGIATMSKSLVMGTVHKYDWYQVGAAIAHPDRGKILDLSQDIANRTGVMDASVKILPWDGYGDPDLIRHLMNQEQPDAILHFTDPRYWVWLYEMEHEIRQNIPILFYAIWDNLPDPLYNRNYYESCDWIGCISKQTYGIVKRLTSKADRPTWIPHKDWQVKYVPHGINSNEYKPVDVPNDFKQKLFRNKEYDFVFLWSNRNIRRKQASDVIMAFKRFCDIIGTQCAAKCLLIMHTQPVDENGTDLINVSNTLASDCNIIFSNTRVSVEDLNYIYNLADCTINIAGNEGFGLTTAESVMAGTPIIVNVTGGLQDQCGFKLDDAYLTADDYVKIGSLHEWRKWQHRLEHGEWVIPVWSKSQTLSGSVPTPYIWDDKVDIDDVAQAMLLMYSTPKDTLKQRGLTGRREFINTMGLDSKNMCNSLIDGIEDTFKNWKPRKRHDLFKIS